MPIRSYVAWWSACRLRVGREHRDGATGDPRPNAVRAARQDDRHPRAEDNTGAIRVGEEGELLRQDVAGLEVRREEDVGIARDLRLDALCLRGVAADGVVEGQRTVQHTAGDLPPLGHLAQGSGVNGGRHLGRDRLHRGENRDLRPLSTESNGQVDGVLADVDFVLQRRRDVDGRVGDNQDLVIGRHVHDEHVAESTPGAQAGLSRHDRTEQFVGVQAPFHQELGLALTNQLHGLGCRRVAVSDVDHARVPEIYPTLPGDLVDLARLGPREWA